MLKKPYRVSTVLLYINILHLKMTLPYVFKRENFFLCIHVADYMIVLQMSVHRVLSVSWSPQQITAAAMTLFRLDACSTDEKIRRDCATRLWTIYIKIKMFANIIILSVTRRKLVYIGAYRVLRISSKPIINTRVDSHNRLVVARSRR